jgi:hypothetical protein
VTLPQSVILCRVRDVRDYRMRGADQEVITRELTWTTKAMISNQDLTWFVAPDRRLNMGKLLSAFQRVGESVSR